VSCVALLLVVVVVEPTTCVCRDNRESPEVVEALRDHVVVAVRRSPIHSLIH